MIAQANANATVKMIEPVKMLVARGGLGWKVKPEVKKLLSLELLDLGPALTMRRCCCRAE